MQEQSPSSNEICCLSFWYDQSSHSALCEYSEDGAGSDKGNNLTLIRKGVEVTKIKGQTKTECDLCTTKGEGTYYIWETIDVPSLDMWDENTGGVLPSLTLLCNTCDSEELSKVEYSYSGIGHQYTGQAYQGKGGKNWTPAVPKCNKSHFDIVNGPEGAGYLRLTSERGGKAVDVAADYALFFSSGWKDLFEPEILRANYGNKPDVPDLATIDRSNWPPLAYIWWKDYGAPNPDVIRYLQWATKEWLNGKTIQFGCFGGHGRTGTFLALMLVEAGMMSGEDAIKWVHDKYCKDAIEGKAQPDFIKQYVPGSDPDKAPWG